MSSEVETSRSLAESEIPPFGRNDTLIMSTYLYQVQLGICRFLPIGLRFWTRIKLIPCPSVCRWDASSVYLSCTMKRVYRRYSSHPQRGSVGGSPEGANSSLPELWQQLEGLEARLHQLKAGLSNLIQLQQAETAPPADDVQAGAQETLRLQEAAEAFELELVSRVMTWQHLQEPFWQAVRFGGLGLLIGWFLAWLAYRG